MRWLYADEYAEKLLGSDPSGKMINPVKIKTNPVREVFKCDRFFFKHDKRFFNGLKAEFRHALKISRTPIPVVRHLAVSRHILVTLAEENTVELKEYLSRNIPDEELLENTGKFIRIMRENFLIHNDLHSGNVLFKTNNKTLMLVDVRSADIAKDPKYCNDNVYIHLVLEMRKYLPRERLYPLLEACGSRDPAESFDKELKRQSIDFFNSWPKRKKQILNGYGKFVRQKNHLRILSDAANELNNAEIIVGDMNNYMLIHYYLELNFIPHRNILAVGNNDIYLAPVPEQSVQTTENSKLFQDFSKRLELCGIKSTPKDWITTPSGIIFVNLESAIRQCNFTE
jgi:hypothetical protein